jgi:hypothetical protein
LRPAQQTCPSLESPPLPEQSISQSPASGQSRKWNHRKILRLANCPSLESPPLPEHSISQSSVADPDPGSGAFLTPRSGIGRKSASGSVMNNPGSYFLELKNQSVNHQLHDQEEVEPQEDFEDSKLPLLGITASTEQSISQSQDSGPGRRGTTGGF